VGQFIFVSTGAKSATIAPETPELWSKKVARFYDSQCRPTCSRCRREVGLLRARRLITLLLIQGCLPRPYTCSLYLYWPTNLHDARSRISTLTQFSAHSSGRNFSSKQGVHVLRAPYALGKFLACELSLLLEQMTNANVTAEQHSKIQ